MGRKKASEKKDDYMHRLVYISQHNPLKFDVHDEKGKKMQDFANVTLDNKSHDETIKGIITIVKKSIKNTKQNEIEIDNIIFPTNFSNDSDMSSCFDE